MKELDKYIINKQFYRFFKRDRFYKAIPISFHDNKVKLKIINNDKSSLYHFFLPVEFLNHSSIKRIKDKKFFTKENILYVSIIKFDKRTNIAICSQFSSTIFINIFKEILNFMLRKFKKDYELVFVRVKFNHILKKIEFFATFKNDKKINGKFLSFFSYILEEKLGNIKINVTYSSKKQ